MCIVHCQAFVYCLIVMAPQCLCTQCWGSALQRIDIWRGVMRWVHMSHVQVWVYVRPRPGLRFTSPDQSWRTTAHSAEPADGWDAEKTAGIGPPFRGAGNFCSDLDLLSEAAPRHDLKSEISVRSSFIFLQDLNVPN